MTDIEKLREKLSTSNIPIKNMTIDDKMLRRYLVAHQTVDAAFQRILATDKWRGEYGVANITKDTPGVKRVMDTRMNYYLDQRDKAGRPVSYVAARRHNAQKRNFAELAQFTVYMLEEGCRMCLEDGPDNFCTLYDMKDFSLLCMDYPAMRNLTEVMRDHYPERMGLCLVLNAPAIFSACWAIIKLWFDERTASKIKFIKTDEELSQYIDPSFVPRED